MLVIKKHSWIILKSMGDCIFIQLIVEQKMPYFLIALMIHMLLYLYYFDNAFVTLSILLWYYIFCSINSTFIHNTTLFVTQLIVLLIVMKTLLVTQLIILYYTKTNPICQLNNCELLATFNSYAKIWAISRTRKES